MYFKSINEIHNVTTYLTNIPIESYFRYNGYGQFAYC